MGQTFLSASWGDFPVAPRPDWKVRRTDRLESLPYTVWRDTPDLNFGIEDNDVFSRDNLEGLWSSLRNCVRG